MKLSIIIICYFGFVSSLYSQNLMKQKPLEFRYLTIDDGLSHNNIRDFSQDSSGYIWIATRNGLNKYNGYEVVNYMHNPSDTNAILSNQINFVFTDSRSTVWIGTNKGLNIYNRGKDNFSKFIPPGINYEISLVKDMTEDRYGTVWIGIGNGICSFNINTQEFQHYTPEKNVGPKPKTNQISKVFIDNKNRIWCSFYNCGISIFDPGTGIFRNFINEPDNPLSISDNVIRKIYQDSKGNIWIGANSALNLFNAVDSTFKRYIIDEINSFSVAVWAIFEDENSNFYVGAKSGIYFLNETTKNISHVAHTDHPHSILNMNTIVCSFKDKQGGLWLGTFAGGVNYANFYRKPFFNYQAKKYNPYFLNNGNVFAILEDNNGNLYIGTDGGMNFLNRKTGKFTHYEHDPDNPNSLSHNNIKCLELDNNNKVWIGTNNGLMQFNPKTGKFINKFIHDPENPNTISSSKIYDLFKDKNGNIWIVSSDDFKIVNIDIYNPVNGQFKHICQKASFNYFSIGFFGSEDRIFIGAFNGFWKYSYANDSLTFFNNDSIIGHTFSIIEDSKKNIWIGSDKGLVYYNPDKNIYKQYSTENDYPFHTIYGILEDLDQNLWISSNAGLIKFHDAVINNASKTFTVYDRQDGLQSKQFNRGASYKSATGEMFFGGINGFNSFFPEQIKNNTFYPEVVLTKLKINNKPVGIDEEINGRVVLKEAFSEAKKITFIPKDINISIEFAAIHFAQPEKNQYAYIMEGFDKEWNYVGNKKEATYTNMDAGEYVFKVKASNNDGVWNEEGISINIIVTPPFWETWWFRGIIVVFLVFILMSIYLLRVNTLKKQKRILEQKVIERTKKLQTVNDNLEIQKKTIIEKNEEISQQNEEILLINENIQSINKKLEEKDKYKTNFFHNITHEFKTPLTLMKGSIDMILDGYYGKINKQLKKQLLIAKKNSVNLNDYINQILELAKIDAKQIKVNIQKFDLINFLKLVYASFASLAQSKNITLNFEPQFGEMTVCFDSAKLEIILNNLLSNAIKYSKENSHINIVAKENNDAFTIAVSDTGIGIPKIELPYIFERFRQLDSGLTRKDKGVGIGLALVKEYVDLLQGSITVDSEPGKGSVFTINFNKDLSKLNLKYIIKTEEEPNYKNDIVEYDFPLIEKPKSNLPDGKNKIATILIIEDNEDMLSFIKKILTDKYTVLEACDGKEGYEVCKRELPDIVVSDVMMPNMDGFGLCKAIVENETTSHIPVILLSANADEKFQHRGLQEGAISYITKPFNPGKLRLQIKNQLNYILKRQNDNWNFITRGKEEITSISTGDTFLKKAQAIVLDNMHEESFDVEAFSITIGLSKTQLHRKMKGITGKSPGDFIRNIKLLEAKAMIENSNTTNLTVAEIAYKVGYSDPSSFTKAFRKQFGVNPSTVS